MKRKTTLLALTAASVFTVSTALAASPEGSQSQDQAQYDTQSSEIRQEHAQSSQIESPMGSESSAQLEQQPSDQPQSSQQASSEQSVRDAQQALKDQGYDVGPVDGKFGPMTSSAVRDFQEDQGIQASGELDEETFAALGVSEQASLQEQPTPMQPEDQASLEQPSEPQDQASLDEPSASPEFQEQEQASLDETEISGSVEDTSRLEEQPEQPIDQR